MPQKFQGYLLHIEAFVVSYTSEVNKKTGLLLNMKVGLRIWRQLAIANEKEAVSQIFTKSHPFMFGSLIHNKGSKIFEETQDF